MTEPWEQSTSGIRRHVRSRLASAALSVGARCNVAAATWSLSGCCSHLGSKERSGIVVVRLGMHGGSVSEVVRGVEWGSQKAEG